MYDLIGVCAIWDWCVFLAIVLSDRSLQQISFFRFSSVCITSADLLIGKHHSAIVTFNHSCINSFLVSNPGHKTNLPYSTWDMSSLVSVLKPGSWASWCSSLVSMSTIPNMTGILELQYGLQMNHYFIDINLSGAENEIFVITGSISWKRA